MAVSRRLVRFSRLRVKTNVQVNRNSICGFNDAGPVIGQGESERRANPTKSVARTSRPHTEYRFFTPQFRKISRKSARSEAGRRSSASVRGGGEVVERRSACWQHSFGLRGGRRVQGSSISSVKPKSRVCDRGSRTVSTTASGRANHELSPLIFSHTAIL